VTREQEDPGSLADELEQEADELERRSQELGEKVSDVKQDWERKRSDEAVPGADPPAEGDDDESGEGDVDEADEGEEQTSGQGEDVPPEREAGDAQADQSG
jgi:hypothetical protein